MKRNRAKKLLVLFEIGRDLEQSLKSIAIIQGRELPAVIANLAEIMLDAMAKEPRVLMRLREKGDENPACFEHVGLASKHYRLAMELASACGLSVSDFFSRLLAIGVEYYPKAASAKKEEIISAIRTDCVFRFSRLA